jgi:GT2 family glycosyltransferase
MMSITVIIPTYRRSKDLARCLESLKRQTRPADEVVVVVRDSDTETWTLLEGFKAEPLLLYTVTVSVPGVVAAMNAGLDAARCDIIATTDDDAAPHADWLERIETHFLSDSRVGAVGGRDWLYNGTQLADGADGAVEVVGRVQWFGRIISHHHIGVGKPREVDLLRGVNMSFRRTAIAGLRFDERLRGAGAQVHVELAFCLAVKRAGFKVIYDPAVAVDHYHGSRFDEDQRGQFNDTAWINSVHNETLALLEHFSGAQRVVFILWAIFIGTRLALGFVQWLRFLPNEGSFAGRKLLASLRGRWLGWRTWQKSINASG